MLGESTLPGVVSVTGGKDAAIRAFSRRIRHCAMPLPPVYNCSMTEKQAANKLGKTVRTLTVFSGIIVGRHTMLLAAWARAGSQTYAGQRS